MNEQNLVDYINENDVTHWVNSVGGSRSTFFRLALQSNPDIRTQGINHEHGKTILGKAVHYSKPLKCNAKGIFLYRNKIEFMLNSQLRRNSGLARNNFNKMKSSEISLEFSIENWINLAKQHINNWTNNLPIDVYVVNTDCINDNLDKLRNEFNVDFKKYKKGPEREIDPVFQEHELELNSINEKLNSLPNFALLKKQY